MTRCQRGARSRGPWDAKCTIDRKRSYSKGFLGIDPPLWLGYIRQYLVTLLPAVQHPMALELSLDVLAPLVSCTMARFPPPTSLPLNCLRFSDGKHFQSAKYCYVLASLTEICVLFQKT